MRLDLRTMLASLLCALGLHCAPAPAPRPVAPPHAAATACPQDFVGGRPPALVNPKLSASAYPLCLSGFAMLFSGVTRTPVYSAEHLTAARIEAARGMVRVDSFHPEPQLPADAPARAGAPKLDPPRRKRLGPEGPPPTVAALRRQGITAVSVACHGLWRGHTCHHSATLTLDRLGVSADTAFPALRRVARLVCGRCGGRELNVAPVWPDVRQGYAASLGGEAPVERV